MTVDFDTTVGAACDAAFGEPVTFIPGAGPPVAAVGVFSDAHKEEVFKGDSPLPITERKPMLGIRMALLPRQPAEGEQFRIRGAIYVVSTVYPDSFGALQIRLQGPL